MTVKPNLPARIFLKLRLTRPAPKGHEYVYVVDNALAGPILFMAIVVWSFIAWVVFT